MNKKKKVYVVKVELADNLSWILAVFSKGGMAADYKELYKESHNFEEKYPKGHIHISEFTLDPKGWRKSLKRLKAKLKGEELEGEKEKMNENSITITIENKEEIVDLLNRTIAVISNNQFAFDKEKEYQKLFHFLENLINKLEREEEK